jgi:hypothetical protein
VSQNEKFEAAWSAEYPVHGPTAFKRSGFNSEAYANTRVQDGWLMWQASRRAALEEAASACEAVRDLKWRGTVFYSAAATECATTIRALAKEANNG